MSAGTVSILQQIMDKTGVVVDVAVGVVSHLHTYQECRRCISDTCQSALWHSVVSPCIITGRERKTCHQHMHHNREREKDMSPTHAS